MNSEERKRVSKRAWIIAGVGSALAIGACAIAVSAFVNQSNHDNAVNALATSQQKVVDAHEELTAAQGDLFSAGVEAASLYDASGEFVAVARVSLLDDAKPLEELKLVREELVETAGLTVDDKDKATPPEQKKAEAAPDAKTPSELDAIKAETKKNDERVSTLEKKTTSLQKDIAAIVELGEEIETLTEDVVTSAATFGDKASFAKATAATTSTLKASVADLKKTEKSAKERFEAYAAAYDAAKTSHDAIIAAEKADADKGATENQNANPGGSENTGGSSNNGGSSDTGGSSNTGGGGKAPAPQPPAPQPEPEPAPEPERIPAQFERGANYVPYDANSCFSNGSHQVGWGGTSMSAASMDALGVPWSATVSGDTVYYWLCM